MMYESFYNSLYTKEMTFKVSHDDLHDLGNPHYALFVYNEDEMSFFLIPLADEERESANLCLDDNFYAFVRSETRRYPKGDYGPNIHLSDSFHFVMQELGIQKGKTYLVPNELVTIVYDGKKVRAMRYFMYDARPECEEDIADREETEYRWQLPFEHKGRISLNDETEKVESPLMDYTYYDHDDYPEEWLDGAEDDFEPNEYEDEDADEDEMSDDEFCRQMDEILKMHRLLGNDAHPKPHKRDTSRIVGFRLPTGEEYGCEEPSPAVTEQAECLSDIMYNMARMNGMTGSSYLTKLQGEMVKYFSPEGFASIKDKTEKEYAEKVRKAFNGKMPSVIRYFMWIITDAQK